MAYTIYLLDENNHVELDTQNIDFTTVFSVAEIKDIAARKDSITKQVSFKGTNSNNQAFGSLFHLNRVTDASLSNKLLFNYSPLRMVDCLVYEDSKLLLHGSMRVLEVNVDKNQFITYQTVITGKFVDFKSIIQDKYLTDLNLSHLKHHYTIDTITNSWNSSIETFDTTSTTFQTSSFELGKGYVYPFIDYGVMFTNNTITNVNRVQALNFRPAIYVKELMNSIFSQPELAGFTYEVKGDSNFLNRFNSLIVPNAEELLTYKFSGFTSTFSKPSGVTDSASMSGGGGNKKLLNIGEFTPPPSTSITPYVNYAPSSQTVLSIKRTFKSDAVAVITFSNISNTTLESSHFEISVVERNEENNQDPYSSGWQVIQQYPNFTLPKNTTLTNLMVTIPLGERVWSETKQVALMVHNAYYALSGGSVSYNIASASIKFPKDEFTTFTTNIQLGAGSTADVIAPVPPDNVKQVDFIKSLINMFNFYVYTENTNPKHIIFERYDDFYAMSNMEYVSTNSLNWTDKIDFNSAVKIKGNLTIPKNYSFLFKDDSDFTNDDYKKKYQEPYGTFKFVDAFGVTDSKKVELIFSPTPAVRFPDSNRVHPALYKVESGNKKPMKTNIRLLYYGGVQSSVQYTIEKDKFASGWTTEVVATKTQYPACSSYFLNPAGIPVDDLNFGRPREFYFPPTSHHLNAKTSYQNYYQNQISELTNQDLVLVECEAKLNEIDINNLSLKTPVYVDMGEFGNTYFKVLEVNYEGNKNNSRCILQKIVF